MPKIFFFGGGILFSAKPSITGKLMLGGGESGHQLTALSPLHNGASRRIQWISMCADAASGYHHCSGSLLCWLQCGQCSVWLAWGWRRRWMNCWECHICTRRVASTSAMWWRLNAGPHTTLHSPCHRQPTTCLSSTVGLSTVCHSSPVFLGCYQLIAC